MVDFFYIIHYIVYRFYRIHGENHAISLLNACGLHYILSFGLILGVDYFVCLTFEMQHHINKPIVWGYAVFWAIFEYFVFHRNERYKEIFGKYMRKGTEPEMRAKFKKAKIFNYSLLVIDLLLLIIADYLNN